MRVVLIDIFIITLLPAYTNNEFYIWYDIIIAIMASAKAASPYKCKECGLAFSSQQDLEEHNRQIHHA